MAIMAKKFICGIDEVGRGALAGPLCVVALAMPVHSIPPIGINDSKKLSAKKRLKLTKFIIKHYNYGISWVFPETIDRINVLQATLLAMRQAVDRLPHEVTSKVLELLIDGNSEPKISYPSRLIVRGDQSEPSIMMASIVAKVARDHYMQTISSFYPLYEFHRHVGYPTLFHRQAIIKYGYTPIHRLSFRCK